MDAQLCFHGVGGRGEGERRGNAVVICFRQRGGPRKGYPSEVSRTPYMARRRGLLFLCYFLLLLLGVASRACPQQTTFPVCVRGVCVKLRAFAQLGSPSITSILYIFDYISKVRFSIFSDLLKSCTLLEGIVKLLLKFSKSILKKNQLAERAVAR